MVTIFGDMAHMTILSNRRKFLQTSAAGVGFWIAAGASAEKSKSPNERLALACIGIGGKGSSDSTDAAAAGDVVAICDIDERRLDNAGKTRFPKAKQFTDYRRMFDEMGDSIDAVTVSTPDHNHAAASLLAMRQGKHCFCQKPLTRTLHEARLMAEEARKRGLSTQMGIQGTAHNAVRQAAAVIQSGVLGQVKEVHVWTDRPIWPQGGSRPEPIECPPHIRWDEWVGPSPMRPYARGYHPFAWRGWWDFGTGALGDMGCHSLNVPFMALDLRDPIAVRAETSGHNRESFPKWATITYEFEARGARPPLNLIWYDGGKIPDRELFDGAPTDLNGCLVVGDKGKLYARGNHVEQGLCFLGGIEMPKVKWTESPGHFQEWIDGIKEGKNPMANFPDYAGPLTETVLLGNLAVWAAAEGCSENIRWDAINLQATNVAGLESAIKPTYRNGYSLDV